MVERDLAKVEVAGSTPVSRSKNSAEQPSHRRFASIHADVRLRAAYGTPHRTLGSDLPQHLSDVGVREQQTDLGEPEP